MPDIIAALADEHGLGDHLHLLRRYVLPCVGFTLEPRDDCPPGSSKLGGQPDLPAAFDWPVYRGRRLDFVLQVDLREVAPLGPRDRLPSAGVLSFFYDLEEQPWGFDPEDVGAWAVRYFPPTVALTRQAPDQPDRETFEAAIRFWAAASLPSYGSRAGFLLETELKEEAGGEDLGDALAELGVALFGASAPAPDPPCHRIGGHSANIQGDMQLEAQLVMHRLYCGDETGYEDPRAAELEPTCEDWELLLQLDSDDEADLMWGDGGMLYFWIRRQDLARQDFSQVWMALQCF